MSHPVISPKKLIEVALPLDAINAACAYEKMPGIGAHPRGIHLWWARRPLAAARAVIFSQLVHDPEDLWRCQNPGKDPNQQVKGHWTKARARLFGIIEELVLWDNTTNEVVLEKAREEIRKAWRETCDLNKDHPQAEEIFNPDKMPGLHDPFAGGGAIPLEAQRLGLEAYASDLNPVAVLINKAMIEFPPKFAGRPPVNPVSRNDKGAKLKSWHDAQGLAEDLRYYGQWMRDEAQKRIGHFYPPIEVTKEIVKERPDLKPYLGEKLTVLAWLWARTVKSPNPAFRHVDVPLVSSFLLSNKEGKEAWVAPAIERDSFRFTVRVGKPSADAKAGTKAARGANFRCLMSGVPIEPGYIKSESVAGRMNAKLMAVVADGTKGRVYIAPSTEHESIAKSAHPSEAPAMIHVPLANDPRNLWCLQYGLDHFDQLFTQRQLLALTTLSDLIAQVRTKVASDAATNGLSSDSRGLASQGLGAEAYADAICLFLAFAIDRCADFGNAMTRWVPGNQKVMNLFGKQAIPMTWDFPEAAILAETVGGLTPAVDYIADCIMKLAPGAGGFALQADSQGQSLSTGKCVSTDPPYYDNIAYADLSDFFYVWLRRSLRSMFPEILSTIAVPKAEELIASPYRHGGKVKAEAFFLDGMTSAIRRLAQQSHPALPVTIYYAFKQSETDDSSGTVSTGWDTFLKAVLESGFSIVGTWPLRSEQEYRAISMGTNALASSIVLVCRPRPGDAVSISRRQFIRELNATLPLALDAMTRESEGLHSPVAPVDLSQAIIGPGMAVFSKYSSVLEADGSPMSVKTALQLINRFLAEDDFDSDTQFCLRWFEQHHWDAGQFGEADVLARAKGTSVEGVKQSGVVAASGGKVQLVRPADYPADWDPASDQRLPIWETLHQLIRGFRSNGETGAGEILAQVQSKAEPARQLAYRLYTLCERAGLAEDARAYNELITSWSAIESAAASESGSKQRTLFE